MHMQKSPTLDLQIVADIPHCEEVGKCHCGGLVVFRHRFKADPPRIECTDCGHEDPKFREYGWVDAKFRKDAVEQLWKSGMGLSELLDEAEHVAIAAGDKYGLVRVRLLKLCLDLRPEEIDDLFEGGWFSDPLNAASAIRRSIAEFSEFSHTWHELERAIKEARGQQ